MSSSAPDARVPEEALSYLATDPFSLAEANINPLTGLSTDYLNHFNEAVMLLEMFPSAPECAGDVMAWRPLAYHEHFARSRLKQRELATAAYDRADGSVRNRFDAVCKVMTEIALSAQRAIAEKSANADIVAARTASRLKRLVALAAAVIHGQAIGGSTPKTVQASQAAIDAILTP